MEAVEHYLAEIGRDPLEWLRMSVEDLARLPFDRVFEHPVFIGETEQLPHKHVLLYHEDEDIESNIIWRCKYCSFWNFLLDQRVMENHLCVECPFIPQALKLELKTYVLVQTFSALEKLL